MSRPEVIIISVLKDVDLKLLSCIAFWVAYHVATLHGKAKVLECYNASTTMALRKLIAIKLRLLAVIM